MRYNVAQLLKEGVGAFREREVSGDLYDIDENNPGPTHCEGQILLIRTPRGILAKGKVHLKLVQACRRCLELATHEVTIEVEEEFIPSVDVETGASLPITDEDEPELVINEYHILDLQEVLRQYAVVAVTSPSLCKPDCKGLCPHCGANLNYETCNCDTRRIDPRLAVLAKLLES
ncbi:MAG: DUF177 domain-containing protein [Anaerolineae bacterium]|nr:DUF177 domain-containing protein [Anaerolineae bacterium]